MNKLFREARQRNATEHLRVSVKSPRRCGCLSNRILKRAIICSIALTAVGAIAAQVRINYHDQDFTLSGFDNFSATLEDKGIAFKGNGNPVTIQIESSGTTLTGANADGNAQRADNGAYFLQNATVSGNSHLVMNGAAAQSYASARGNKASANETTNTDIKSDTLRYSGTATDGKVEFPGTVAIDSSTKGQSVGKDKKTTDYNRLIHLTGSSGFVTMKVSAAGNNALQTGQINGPVTYSGNSQSKDATGQMQTTTFDGKSDGLTFDFTKEPRTLTLTGHVTLNSKGVGATGDIAADTVVVTLDANLKPTKIDITGSPAKTTLHQEPPR